MQRTRCRLETMYECAEHIWHVRLIPETQVDYLPGQYLQVVMSETDKRPFSIACSPERGNVLELQISAVPGNPYPNQVLDLLREKQAVDVEIPLGKAYFRKESTRPILLLAGGTGYSYVRAILQYLVDHDIQRPVTLYWGVRQADQLYEGEDVLNWATEFKQLSFAPVVQNPDHDWPGKTGLLHEALLADIDDFSAYDIYVAGRFEMAKLLRTELLARGANADHLYGDAY